MKQEPPRPCGWGGRPECQSVGNPTRFQWEICQMSNENPAGMKMFLFKMKKNCHSGADFVPNFHKNGGMPVKTNLRKGPASGADEKLEDAVGGSGIAEVGLDDRVQFGQDAFTEAARAHDALAGLHQVHVATQRIDLAVVGQHPQRMRSLPARERVGTETSVHQRQIRLVFRSLQNIKIKTKLQLFDTALNE